MTDHTVRIFNKHMNATDMKEMLDWLHTNIGEYIDTSNNNDLVRYYGKNWKVSWLQHGTRFILDATFNDPKDALFFILRWK